jgi:hypothetical protein
MIRYLIFFCVFLLFRLQAPAETLDAEARINIIRTLGSEYVALKVPLPVNATGIVLDSRGEFDWKKNEKNTLSASQFLPPGAKVQVTSIEFAGSRLIFEINGGGKKKDRKKRFLEKIQIGGAGGMTPVARPTAPVDPQGSYVSLQFDGPIPNLTPQEVKSLLTGVLDFSKKSALNSFLDSVPDEFREAVKNKRAAVGMDKDLVLAAMGRPDRRIREGVTEDWIYGERPLKVVFVTFSQGQVISVKEY